MVEADRAQNSSVDQELISPSDSPPGLFSPGKLAMALLLILAVSGLLMTLSYRPVDAVAAQEMLQTLSVDSGFFNFSRRLHRWSALLLVVLIVVHWLLLWWSKSYRAPRRISWSQGLILLVVTMILTSSGFLLRWDVKSVALVQLGLVRLTGIRALDQKLTTLILGGAAAGTVQIRWIYILHTLLLPALLLAGAVRHARFSGRLYAGSDSRALSRSGALPALALTLLALFAAALLPLDPLGSEAATSPLWPHPDWLWVADILPAWMMSGTLAAVGAALVPLLAFMFFWIVPALESRISSPQAAWVLFAIGAVVILGYMGSSARLANKIPYQGCGVCHRSTMVGRASTAISEVVNARDPAWLKFHLTNPVESILNPAE